MKHDYALLYITSLPLEYNEDAAEHFHTTLTFFRFMIVAAEKIVNCLNSEKIEDIEELIEDYNQYAVYKIDYETVIDEQKSKKAFEKALGKYYYDGLKIDSYNFINEYEFKKFNQEKTDKEFSDYLKDMKRLIREYILEDDLQVVFYIFVQIMLNVSNPVLFSDFLVHSICKNKRQETLKEKTINSIKKILSF